MLGETIEDPYGIESHEPVCAWPRTASAAYAIQAQEVHRACRRAAHPRLVRHRRDAPEITGYEIHMGSVTPTDADAPAFTVVSRNGEFARYADGAMSSAGNVVGTMLHGIFENESIRSAIARRVAAAKRPRDAEGSQSRIATRNMIGSPRPFAAISTMRALRDIIGI